MFRSSESLMIRNQVFEFKPVSRSTLQPFEKGVLYNCSIKKDHEARINYLTRSLREVNYFADYELIV